jgi:beta-1,4-N-acetylglucosaminyltransferase
VTFPTADARQLLSGEEVHFAAHPTNRSVKNLLRNFVIAFRVVSDLRPAAVVTTGAGVAVPFCYVAKLFGAKIIYIESLARITELSLTGRLIYPIADRLFVQWPQLEESVAKAEYAGNLL